VIVRFSVDEQGKACRESVLKGVSPEIDEEALRVVRMLPRFEPGRQGGKAVPVWYMVPINFTLR
jgi:protein TonB